MAANALNFGNKVVFLNGLPFTMPIASSDPGSAVAGDTYYNSTSGTIHYYNGSMWLTLATGGSAVTSISVATANGLAGNSSGGSTPSLTLSTTVTGILQGNGTAISAATTTGSGAVVLATSPSLVTPNIGDASASSLNISGLTPSQAVFTDGSDNLVSNAITGTGNVVMSNSPALVTPNLGTPSTLVGTNITGTAAGLTAGTVTTNANLTGDVTSVGNATTLATVNGNVGSFGSSTSIPSFTVNAKGLITAASGNAVVAPAGTLSGTTLNSSVVSSSLTSLGIQGQALNMGSFQINNLASPSASTDAANKGYVDAAINGLYWKGPVQSYAASNVPLTGSTPLVIDGHTVADGDLILLGAQTTASQNGEYTASVIGGSYTLTANGQPTAAGDAWLVLDGTVYANSAFVATAAVPAATFVEFAGPTALIFTSPLILTGNTVSIQQATTSQNGYLSSTDWNTFNNKQPAGNYITALTGDATASGPGSAALTLATVNVSPGTFAIASVTVNGKGLVTAASAATTTGSGSVVLATSPTLVTPNIGAASASSLNISGLTASQAVFTDGSDNLVSNPITGSGNVVMSASPTLTGTIAAAAANFSGAIGANGGITSSGNLLINANAGASAIQLESASFQRSSNGTNFISEAYFDSTSLTDNTTAAVAAFQFAYASFAGEEIMYVIESGDAQADCRIGTLRISANNSGTIATSLSDMFTETADCGVIWSASISGANVVVSYTTSNQGAARTMRADVKLLRR